VPLFIGAGSIGCTPEDPPPMRNAEAIGGRGMVVYDEETFGPDFGDGRELAHLGIHEFVHTTSVDVA
jgi:hypothetical protein